MKNIMEIHKHHDKIVALRKVFGMLNDLTKEQRKKFEESLNGANKQL